MSSRLNFWLSRRARFLCVPHTFLPKVKTVFWYNCSSKSVIDTISCSHIGKETGDLDLRYHFPPELFNLLVDTIPRLVRGKRDVVLFFRGAGVRNSVTADIEGRLRQDRESLNKFDITRTLLQRLNEAGDAAIRERRELLKRVVEFEDFSTCWENEQLAARGLVAQIQKSGRSKGFLYKNETRERGRTAKA